jgi:hypothetical protein
VKVFPAPALLYFEQPNEWQGTIIKNKIIYGSDFYESTYRYFVKRATAQFMTAIYRSNG